MSSHPHQSTMPHRATPDSPHLSDYRAHYRADAELIADPEALPAVRSASEARRLAAIVRLLDLRPGDRVVDVGCGSGWLSQLCAERGAWVVAADIAPAGVAAARRRYPSIGRYTVADVYHLPLRPGRFDVAVLSEVIEHLEDLDAALAQVRALLRPGGRVLIAVPYRETILQHLCIHCNKLTPANAHLHSFDEPALTRLLQTNGLRPVRRRRLANKLLELIGFPHHSRWLPQALWRAVDGAFNLLTGRAGFVVVLAVDDA